MAVQLDEYRLLGGSGLRVSPVALGTMSFGGDPENWGSYLNDAQRMFDAYVERGGNFIDTANHYCGGAAEQLLGTFALEKRERLVLATRYSLSTRAGDPNASGNHRRSMIRAVEDSLRRLDTDRIDLLTVQMWDALTPVDEVLRGLDDLVYSGKVLYTGLADTPAWRAAQMQTMARLQGWTGFSALQVPYSLVERTVERELLPMAAELGMAVIAAAPLGGGVLAGKYTPEDLQTSQRADEHSRRGMNAARGLLTDRNLAIAAVAIDIAMNLGRSPAQIALAWLLQNLHRPIPVLGARTWQQFEDNLAALRIDLAPEDAERLTAASRTHLGFPRELLESPVAARLFGDVVVAPRG